MDIVPKSPLSAPRDGISSSEIEVIGVLVPLRRRSVRWVWAAGAISDIGTWVQLVVVGSLIARNTGSALLTGLVAVATFLPQGIGSPIGGVIADRVDRRKLLATTLTLQCLLTAVLGALITTGHTSAALLSSVVFFQSMAGNLGGPAYQAMLPAMVPARELPPMVSLSMASWNSGRIIGPLLGTILDRLFGAGGVVFVNAASFAVLAAVVVALRRPFAPAQRTVETHVVQEFRDGWRAFTKGHTGTFLLWSTVVVSVFITPFMGLMPIVARKLLNGGTGTAGLLSASQGVGAIAGIAATAGFVVRFGRSAIVRWSIPIMCGAYVVYSLASWTPLAMAMVGVMGSSAALWYGSTQAVAQRDAPEKERARLLSLLQASFGISYGVGLVGLGKLGDIFGIRPVNIAAAICGVIGTVLVERRHPGWRKAIDNPA
jgi:MFS family permease